MKFWKYHGLGNDFVLVDGLHKPLSFTAEEAQRICDRRRGIGGDGILVILPSDKAPYRMRIYNSDGSLAEMCGNGIRCVAKYLRDFRTDLEEIPLETDRGVLTCKVFLGDSGQVETVRVDMGQPLLAPPEIPMNYEGERCVEVPFEWQGHSLNMTALSMGNPHLVLFEDPDQDRSNLGPSLEHHPLFPNRTNVEFVKVRGEKELEVVVYERGCGFTEACGTGACASAVAAVLTERILPGEEVAVRLPGGTLFVEVLPDLSTVWMRGPATLVYEGSLPDIP